MIVISKEWRWARLHLIGRRFKNRRCLHPAVSDFCKPFDSPTLLADLVAWLNQQQPEVVAGEAWLAARYPEIIHELTALAFKEKQ